MSPQRSPFPTHIFLGFSASHRNYPITILPAPDLVFANLDFVVHA